MVTQTCLEPQARSPQHLPPGSGLDSAPCRITLPQLGINGFRAGGMILSSSVLQMELQATAKAGDFHLLLTGGRSKRMPYTQRARQRFPQALCHPAALPAPGNLTNHPGSERNGEPRVCCGAGGLTSLPGSLGFPALHMLDAFLWMGFAGIPGRSSLSQRLLPLQPPKARGERWDLAALSLRCIPAGRNSFNCWLLPFLQGRQRRTRQLRGRAVYMSSVLSVGLADTSLVPAHHPHPASLLPCSQLWQS